MHPVNQRRKTVKKSPLVLSTIAYLLKLVSKIIITFIITIIIIIRCNNIHYYYSLLLFNIQYYSLISTLFVPIISVCFSAFNSYSNKGDQIHFSFVTSQVQATLS
jgi:hypothetical protein